MAKRKRKLSAEERAELAEFEARSEANLLRLRELVDRGWADLEAKREAARRGELELDPAWAPPPREA